MEDEVPTNSVIRVAVKRKLKNGRAGDALFIRAEDIKKWLRGMEDEEDPEKEGYEGAGDRWRLFVKLIQSIWRTGSIPQQMPDAVDHCRTNTEGRRGLPRYWFARTFLESYRSNCGLTAGSD